ncbi:hypothetical protein B9J78_03770 [bacterium Unc6]|nr:hypothetical protein [bacterium Unc6]
MKEFITSTSVVSLTFLDIWLSLRGAMQRSNLTFWFRKQDCFTLFAMTNVKGLMGRYTMSILDHQTKLAILEKTTGGEL